MKYKKGDIVTLKKEHPCGENKWEILRTGVDIKLQCTGCLKQVWLTRIEFEKRIRKIKTIDGKFISIVHYDENTGLKVEDWEKKYNRKGCIFY